MSCIHIKDKINKDFLLICISIQYNTSSYHINVFMTVRTAMSSFLTSPVSIAPEPQSLRICSRRSSLSRKKLSHSQDTSTLTSAPNCLWQITNTQRKRDLFQSTRVNTVQKQNPMYYIYYMYIVHFTSASQIIIMYTTILRT